MDPEKKSRRGARGGVSKIEALLDRGVLIPHPESVFISDEVDVTRISGQGVVLWPGTRICGEKTFIDKGAGIGTEGPAMIQDCQLGANVELKSGFYEKSVFFKDVSMGWGSHVRKGCLLEEGVKTAHAVGLKQTILFPFVTLGSLINFCDCLMSGGTGPRDHSEVGSAYIHFNYTPNQDKATPSLLGDAPRGVMLNQPPIFLGGQGGLVGPRRVAFGTVVAAGCVHRVDALEPHFLFTGEKGKGRRIKRRPGLYPGIGGVVENNFIYLANLIALTQWHRHVRSLFVSDDAFPRPLFSGAALILHMAVEERLKRLRELFEKAPPLKKHLPEWEEIEGFFIHFKTPGETRRQRDPFLERVAPLIGQWGKDYIRVIQNLPVHVSRQGTGWLQGIIDMIQNKMSETLPGLI